MNPDITVITGTYNRPKDVARTIHALRSQQTAARCEHLVIADGRCKFTRNVCEAFDVSYLESREERVWGAAPKDHGVKRATGEYLVFWDDDNIYFPNAIEALWRTVQGADAGFCCIHTLVQRGRLIVDVRPEPGVELAGTDYMCVIVRREIAKQVRFSTPGIKKKFALHVRKGEKGDAVIREQKLYDRRWVKGILRRTQSVRFSSEVIGVHL